MEGAETGKDLSTAGEEGEGDLMRLEGEKRTKNIEEGRPRESWGRLEGGQKRSAGGETNNGSGWKIRLRRKIVSYKE